MQSQSSIIRATSPAASRRRQRGQTLIEVMIATTVVGLVMTAVAAIVTISLQNTSRAKAKALATKYTQEGIEYFRAQRNLMGWESFYATLSLGTPTYCLATLPYSEVGGLQNLDNTPCDPGHHPDPNGIYQRGAVVTFVNVSGQPTVNVVVATTWTDGDRLAESRATIQFQQSSTTP